MGDWVGSVASAMSMMISLDQCSIFFRQHLPLRYSGCRTHPTKATPCTHPIDADLACFSECGTQIAPMEKRAEVCWKSSSKGNVFGWSGNAKAS